MKIQDVQSRVTQWRRQMGRVTFLDLLEPGTLPADLTRKNMTLFAQEVMPALRQELNSPPTIPS